LPSLQIKNLLPNVPRSSITIFIDAVKSVQCKRQTPWRIISSRLRFVVEYKRSQVGRNVVQRAIRRRCACRDKAVTT
jgi:hypothetical protein